MVAVALVVAVLVQELAQVVEAFVQGHKAVVEYVEGRDKYVQYVDDVVHDADVHVEVVVVVVLVDDVDDE